MKIKYLLITFAVFFSFWAFGQSTNHDFNVQQPGAGYTITIPTNLLPGNAQQWVVALLALSKAAQLLLKHGPDSKPGGVGDKIYSVLEMLSGHITPTPNTNEKPASAPVDATGAVPPK